MARYAKKLTGLLNNLLIWSKAEQGLLIMKPQALIPHLITEDVLPLFSYHAKERKLKINNMIDPDLLVFADKEAVHTIFRNLISNSVHNTENGKITISSVSSDDMAEIVIADTGVGMNEYQLEQVFSLSGKHHAGLGLLLCKELADRNNMIISIRSEVGIGTTVALQIPLFKTL